MGTNYDIQDIGRRSFIGKILGFSAALGMGLVSFEAYAANKKRLAIILDDAGANKRDTTNILTLKQQKIPITIAVLPKYHNTQQALEALANYNAANIMLHQPMEPQRMHKRGLRIEEDPKAHTGIYLGDSEAQIASTLYRNIASCDDALRKLKSPKRVVGINNHMGSAATADTRIMEAVCTTLKEYERLHGRPLIWVDSNTTPKTVSMGVAKAHGLTAYKSGGFLDTTTNSPKGEQALETILNAAKKLVKGNQDNALLIGHMKNNLTIEAILHIQEILKSKGLPIELVTVSNL